MKRLDELTARIKALMGSAPPGFGEFVEMWDNMDELSRSLYVLSLSCPQLIGATGPYWDAVRSHLARMGIVAKPFTLESVLKEVNGF